MTSRNKFISVAVLLTVALTYSIFLFVTAYQISISDHPSSTSQGQAFRDLIFGTVCVLAFVATGFSFSRHRSAALIVRIFVGVLSAAGAAFAVLLFYSTSFEISGVRPVPYTVGSLFLLGYFVATLLTALPVVSAQRAFGLRFVLHFGILPAALCAKSLLAQPSDYYMTFSAFGLHLVAAVPFVVLSFRMYELRLSINRNANQGRQATATPSAAT